MAAGGNGNDLGFAEKAFNDLNDIMSGSQKNMLENMNRANKGELFVLHYLTVRGAEVLPSELSAALHASTARVSALLGALEKKGLIEREIDGSNRRNILVTITEAGRIRAKAETGEIRRSVTRVFTEMGEADTAEFIRLTRQFSELAKKYAPFQREEAQNEE